MNLSLIMEEAARFAVIEATEIQKLLEDEDSSNTKKATKVAVKLFNKYLAERSGPDGKPQDILAMPESELNLNSRKVTNPSTIFTTAKLLLISELTEPILF